MANSVAVVTLSGIIFFLTLEQILPLPDSTFSHNASNTIRNKTTTLLHGAALTKFQLENITKGFVEMHKLSTTIKLDNGTSSSNPVLMGPAQPYVTKSNAMDITTMNEHSRFRATSHESRKVMKTRTSKSTGDYTRTEGSKGALSILQQTKIVPESNSTPVAIVAVHTSSPTELSMMTLSTSYGKQPSIGTMTTGNDVTPISYTNSSSVKTPPSNVYTSSSPGSTNTVILTSSSVPKTASLPPNRKTDSIISTQMNSYTNDFPFSNLNTKSSTSYDIISETKSTVRPSTKMKYDTTTSIGSTDKTGAPSLSTEKNSTLISKRLSSTSSTGVPGFPTTFQTQNSYQSTGSSTENLDYHTKLHKQFTGISVDSATIVGAKSPTPETTTSIKPYSRGVSLTTLNSQTGTLPISTYAREISTEFDVATSYQTLPSRSQTDPSPSFTNLAERSTRHAKADSSTESVSMVSEIPQNLQSSTQKSSSSIPSGSTSTVAPKPPMKTKPEKNKPTKPSKIQSTSKPIVKATTHVKTTPTRLTSQPSTKVSHIQTKTQEPVKHTTLKKSKPMPTPRITSQQTSTRAARTTEMKSNLVPLSKITSQSTTPVLTTVNSKSFPSSKITPSAVPTSSSSTARTKSNSVSLIKLKSTSASTSVSSTTVMETELVPSAPSAPSGTSTLFSTKLILHSSLMSTSTPKASVSSRPAFTPTVTHTRNHHSNSNSVVVTTFAPSSEPLTSVVKTSSPVRHSSVSNTYTGTNVHHLSTISTLMPTLTVNISTTKTQGENVAKHKLSSHSVGVIIGVCSICVIFVVIIVVYCVFKYKGDKKKPFLPIDDGVEIPRNEIAIKMDMIVKEYEQVPTETKDAEVDKPLNHI